MTNEGRKIRILMAKPGLDGHDRGARVITRGLMDAGFEVVYTGLHQTPLQIVNTAIQEDVDVIGLSILSGAHVKLTSLVMEQLKQEKAEDMMVIVGGVVPEEDIPKLLKLGVAGVFTSGTTIQSVCNFISEKAGTRKPAR
ncbi:MAG: Methylmalonyl-CoA mutase [Syntrophorhabdus sp. PtaU1.Bin058]|nr:MAG: Methylmalonyl-CoA mutase [Syntrophorhabdus sp. PtaU1.Bin058]